MRRVIAVLCLLGALLAPAAADDQALMPPVESHTFKASRPGFVGAERCGACHTNIQKAWTASHHHAAMLPATPDAVLGDFDNTKVTFGKTTARFFRRANDYFVETQDASGALNEFQVQYTFGVYPLQQYLLPLEDGRLQAFNIAWDARTAAEGGQRWFHLYPDEVPEPGDRLHWTGADQNWNHMCAECHSTDLVKAYRSDARSYETTFVEINVACESCHGPGARHVAWAEKAAETGASPSEAPVIGKGFDVAFHERDGVVWHSDAVGTPKRSVPRETQYEIDTCARCHSRRSRLNEAVIAGAQPEQSHRLALLEPGLYHADGQVDGEVYVLGSFLQSRMHAAGVTCSDCHDPHSLQLRKPGDGMCLSCHKDPTIATAAHHHHPEVSAGARCISCHMPAKTFMGVDVRHDHSFRIPRPDFSLAFGVPNVCTDCHAERDAEWAAAMVNDWVGGAELGGFQTWAETFHLDRIGDPRAREQLLSLAQNPQVPEIARATAATDLAHWLNPAVLAALQTLRDDPSPRVRRAAVMAMAALPPNPPEGLLAETLAPALTDEVRSVQIAAIEALQRFGPAGAEFIDASDAATARVNYASFLELDADRPEGQNARAGSWLAAGDWQGAEQAYREALRIEPGNPVAVVNLSDLLRATGRDADAGALLAENLTDASDPGIAHAYGLWLIRQGQADAAIEYLRQAALGALDNPRYGYVLAVALDSSGARASAMRTLTEVLERHPWHRDSLSAAVFWQQQEGLEPGQYAERLLLLQRADRGF